MKTIMTIIGQWNYHCSSEDMIQSNKGHQRMINTIKCFAKTENTSSLCVIRLLTFVKFAVSLE